MINNGFDNGPARSSGVALVLVLAFLVLITVFVVAFFSSVTTERTTSKDYANQVSTKQLADSAVNLVMAQIVDATTGTNSVSRLAWASQPGMIRTYDVTGADAGFYKLYSSKNMVTHQAQLAADLAADVPANWYSMPAFYTDLNSPVLVSDTAGGIVPNSSAPGDKYTAEYPILNPLSQVASASATPATGQAPGFSITGGSAGYNGTNPPASNYNPTQSAGATAAVENPAPMPVQWLYELQDGTLTAPDVSGSNGIASWSGTAGVVPRSNNPIVGRIAFWTDDDTSKININTAGGDQQNAVINGVITQTTTVNITGTIPAPGSFWDIPRTESAQDRSLAQNQLVQNEFQRYAGHPATVALSLLFPDLTRDQVLALTPRLTSSNSSEGGTFNTTAATANASPVPIALNRLYASTDELFFQPGNIANNRLLNTTGTAAGTVTPNLIIDRYRFFLTAYSRAPETNLFNLPRITIWPVAQQISTNYRTATDSLIAFCSTTGTNRFYFQRSDSTSMTSDFSNIPRNQQLYSYLQSLTGQKIPGASNSVLGTNCPPNGFSDKYTALERDQILTEIFDYIRSANLQDPEILAAGGTPYTPPSVLSSGSMPLGCGQVTPIRIITSSGTTQGFGRFPTIAEAAIVWITTSSSAYPILPHSMQAVLMFETMNPSLGYATYRPSLQHVLTVTGSAPTVTVSGTNIPLDFVLGPSNLGMCGTNTIVGIAGDYLRSWGGVEGISSPFFATIISPQPPSGNGHVYGTVKTIPATRATQSDPSTVYPFYSSKVDLGGTNTHTFDFNGATFNLAVQTGAGTVQQLTFTFPPVSGLPTPEYAVNPSSGAAVGTRNTWTGRVAGLPGIESGEASDFLLTGPTTVIRALEASGTTSGANAQGDYRLIAAHPTVPQGCFLPHANYYKSGPNPYFNGANYTMTGSDSVITTGSYRAYSLCTAIGGQQYTDAAYGKLVPGANYASGNGSNPTPLFPSSIPSGAVISTTNGGTIPGDWDNGIADIMDGAYINKVDEGTCANTGTSIYLGSYTYTPYYEGIEQLSPTFHSPNRQIASAVMFGSLPTGVIRWQPWQSLLFHPDPTGGLHPGSAAPKDYYWLDLFNMPVVEPYAISEPFSTAGKVNLNYQIIPFTYIKRTTALRAVLESTMTMAIPTSHGGTYKSAEIGGIQSNLTKMEYRHAIDPDATLQQFDARFASNDIFRSAAEICDMELVPKADGLLITGSQTAAGMPAFWNSNLLTGNNTRDMPYNHIYPLLTTKSNTYTVHFRVQSLQKPTTDPNPAQWNPAIDKITGEYRGSTMIERYIDASDPNLPDFATNQTSTMYAYYKFRVNSTKRFEP